MRALARPQPEHVYDPQIEIDNLIQHRDAVPEDVSRNRNIPATGQAERLLLASWNIATLGVHKRRPADNLDDFDAAIFPDIFNAAAPAYWRSCAKYYISDHRPLWMQLEL